MMHGFTLAKIVLMWMAWLVAPASVPWGDTYPETAQAIADACDQNATCAATTTALAFHESRFKPDAVGDGGASHGAFQLSKHWLAPGAPIDEQARVAVALVKRSRAICRGRPADEQLGWYASGGTTCGRPGASRVRMRLAKRLLAE